MRKYTLSVLFAFLAVAAALSLTYAVRGQGPGGLDAHSIETQGENMRQVEGVLQTDDPQAPSISVIDSPSPTCYQPDATRDECYLTWYYISVNAAPASSMLTVTLTLDNVGPVAHTQGFFQPSMYIPYSMLGDGFKVACGSPGAGGNPILGNAYGYAIRARDSDGRVAGNFGTIYCPPFNP